MIPSPCQMVIRRDPECEEMRDTMEFRLTYEGVLLSTGNKSRPKHVHDLRRRWHPQLRRLFDIHPAFASLNPRFGEDADEPRSRELDIIRKDYARVIDKFERWDYKFFPLATKSLRILCSVNILFLRSLNPGGVIQSRGDIDNKIATVFDSLQVPKNKEELGGYLTPRDDESPFFCLLGEDNLINHATVEADALLEPTSADAGDNDARLVITVRLSPYGATWGNLGFG
jgi:hypothetical protein